jgi:hypothetical protein
MSQGKYFGRLKGYNLITLKKVDLWHRTLWRRSKKHTGRKENLIAEKNIYLLRPAYSLKYAICFPSNNNKMNKTVAA